MPLNSNFKEEEIDRQALPLKDQIRIRGMDKATQVPYIRVEEVPHQHEPIQFSLNLSAPDPQGLVMKNVQLRFCQKCKLSYFELLPDSQIPSNLMLGVKR